MHFMHGSQRKVQQVIVGAALHTAVHSSASMHAYINSALCRKSRIPRYYPGIYFQLYDTSTLLYDFISI